jgi:hypothetical protein
MRGGLDVTMGVSDMVGVEIAAVVMEAKKLGGKGEGRGDKSHEVVRHQSPATPIVIYFVSSGDPGGQRSSPSDRHGATARPGKALFRAQQMLWDWWCSVTNTSTALRSSARDCLPADATVQSHTRAAFSSG